ncbi:WD40 repeat-like protein, partial [Coemansia reversa NRRL 1564]
VLSSSVDGEIAVWDIRQSANQPSLVLKSDDPILSFDISVDKTAIIGGTQLNSEYAAKILMWDMRMAGTPSRVFEDSHSDDVTQIHCNKNSPSQMLSGSTDGLLCTFDLSQPDEDEALQFVANTGASVSKCGYFGPDSQFIFAHSDMETLQLWTNEATRLADFGDVRELGQSDMLIDYIVKCEYDAETQRLYMVAGTNEGSLHIMHVGVESMEHIQTLNGGHTNIVRGFDWKLSEGCALSGCEEGRISWWS